MSSHLRHRSYLGPGRVARKPRATAYVLSTWGLTRGHGTTVKLRLQVPGLSSDTENTHRGPGLGVGGGAGGGGGGWRGVGPAWALPIPALCYCSSALKPENPALPAF